MHSFNTLCIYSCCYADVGCNEWVQTKSSYFLKVCNQSATSLTFDINKVFPTTNNQTLLPSWRSPWTRTFPMPHASCWHTNGWRAVCVASGWTLHPIKPLRLEHKQHWNNQDFHAVICPLRRIKKWKVWKKGEWITKGRQIDEVRASGLQPFRTKLAAQSVSLPTSTVHIVIHFHLSGGVSRERYVNLIVTVAQSRKLHWRGREKERKSSSIARCLANGRHLISAATSSSVARLCLPRRRKFPLVQMMSCEL